MDLKGSLIDTNLKIYPSIKFITFIKTITITSDVPQNILRIIQNDDKLTKKEEKFENPKVQFSNADLKKLNEIKNVINSNNNVSKDHINGLDNSVSDENVLKTKLDDECTKRECESKDDTNSEEKREKVILTTSDINWVYAYINERRNKSAGNIPYLHELFVETDIVMPENKLIKRNPVLEARCVKLRSQQEAREYRKMTKGVDNVRMRFPEDSISYQIKQLNRQLIAIGQFLLSIFAGFLFGFKGIEWMIGSLDFGFKLLLGVMCALIIALAEIYFLAKKLNEELMMTETVQLGGPPKFANQPEFRIPTSTNSESSVKEHQD